MSSPEPRGARRFVVPVLLGLLATLLANAAWLVAVQQLEPGDRLTGVHTLNGEDTPTYYAWIDQARRGEWLFAQRYTPEVQRPLLLHPLFLVVGRLAEPSGLSNAGVYHAARVALGLLLVPCVWLLLCAAGSPFPARVAGLAVLLLSGGLGFLWAAAGAMTGPAQRWPIDLWVPEASGFLSLVESPLHLASFALWALLGACALRVLRGPGALPVVATALLAALLVSVRPYAAAGITALALLGGVAVLLLRRATPKRVGWLGAALLGGAGLGAAPAAAALLFGPTFAAWGSASAAPVPPPLAVLSGLAFPLGFAALGVAPLLARRGAAGPFVLAWAASALLLAHLPLGPQQPVARKLLEGLPVPLAVLAGEGLWRLGAGGVLRRSAAAGLVALSMASPALLLLRDARAFAAGGMPYVMPACLAEGFAQLAATGEPEQVVLAPPGLGLWVPALGGHHVVCCHRDQTLDVRSRLDAMKRFYGPGPAPRAGLLERERVSFVLFHGADAVPADVADRLTPLFETACLRGFAVRE